MKTHHLLLFGILCATSTIAAENWYRGNTHTHTVICGHADSTPEFVAAWYHDHGYNFVVLSEHNHFIDPKTVKLPENPRKDFILVPGVEITGPRHVHTTGMNVNAVLPWKFAGSNKTEVVQYHANGAIAAGGHPILNHPNFHFALDHTHIRPVKRLHMFELYNGHPSVWNAGNSKNKSTEKLWDTLLTDGMLIYGVSSDDAHHFQTLAPNKSNPGRGWVMVSAPKLEAKAITTAMVQGKFYASNGVFLKTCKRGPDTYEISIDVERTKKELADNPRLRGKRVKEGTEGFRIDFIGPEGKVLSTTSETQGTFAVTKTHAYVRPKITYVRVHKKDPALIEEYYAWGQPIFTDARAKVDPAKAK
jgi:hypothetical protein